MKERPICANKNCNKPALVMMADNYYCGDCIAKWHRKKVEMLQKELEDLNGD